LRIVTRPGGRISGRVVFEGNARAASRLALRVFAQSADLSRPPVIALGVDPLTNGTVQGDGTFTLEGVSGEVFLRLPTSPQVVLKSVTADGQDATDTPLDLAGRESVTDVRIVLSDRVTDVSGQVASSQGAAVQDYVVVVVPAEPVEGLAQTRYIRLARGDSNGRFDMQGLPPSRYVAVALHDDAMENGQQFSPDFQDRVRRAGRSFSLKEGETFSLDLTIGDL